MSRQFARAAAARKEDAARARARRRLMTLLFGVVSRFEEHVGRDLWGHGLPPDRLTPAQRAWRGVWEACRTACLDFGNAQIRAQDQDQDPH